MVEWKQYELGQICDYIRDRIQAVENYISTENMLPNKGGIYETITIPSGTVTVYQVGDILVSNIRPYFRKIWYADRDGGCSADVLCIRAKDNVDSKYLYYLLSQQAFFDYVMSGAKGCKMPRGDKNQIMQWPVSLPPLAEQKRIAAILGALDDKIELNRRINANLEEQAQALFKSWFVDFEPFRDGPFVDSELGKIPKGWKVNSIEDLASYIASGGTPRSLDSSYYDGDIRWFTTKELKDEFLFDSEKHISQTALKNSAAKLFPENTVLMAIYASPTVGRLGILTAESTCNQAAVGIIAKEEIGYAYLYLLLLSERINLNNLASGAAQQNLNVGIVKRYRVLVPTIDILGTFNEIINPIFATIRNNTAQIYNLSALRDTLLPKLMSSKLSVESDYVL